MQLLELLETRVAAPRDPCLGVPVPSQFEGARARGQQPSGAIHSMHILLSAPREPASSNRVRPRGRLSLVSPGPSLVQCHSRPP